MNMGKLILVLCQRLYGSAVAFLDRFPGQEKFHETNMADPRANEYIGAINLQARHRDLFLYDAQRAAQHLEDARHRAPFEP